ncbi:MAG: hypothetical protein KDA85_13235, partial [Planctomycetaceae bacterium]|nr:hypothetical protein [Planctomycetaceae bacterium]
MLPPNSPPTKLTPSELSTTVPARIAKTPVATASVDKTADSIADTPNRLQEPNRTHASGYANRVAAR